MNGDRGDLRSREKWAFPYSEARDQVDSQVRGISFVRERRLQAAREVESKMGILIQGQFHFGPETPSSGDVRHQ
jgi:hypothetical protein